MAFDVRISYLSGGNRVTTEALTENFGGDIRHENMVDLRCMSYTSKGNSELVVAGLQDSMFIVDVERGVIIDKVRIAERKNRPLPRTGQH